MKYNYPYLNDMKFLKYLTGLHSLSYITNITVLDWKLNPIEEIQGKVISGNFTIDGKSSVRRVGNLSFYLDEIDNKVLNLLNLISINKKISVEIGFINETKQYLLYPILWFPLGIYVIIEPTISYGTGGITVNLQIKDKMCLLNGLCGGTLTASTVFDNYETIDKDGGWVILRPTIYQIITELVNHFGGLQLGKIIISDLDTRVKQVVKWTGDFPLYFLKNDNQYLLTIKPSEYEEYINNPEYHWQNVEGSPFEYGDNIGYIFVDFTYPGDLIANAGLTIVSVLEKIKSVLGNFEYFYDINGNFIFQEIKNYLNNSLANYILNSLSNKKFLPLYIKSLSNNTDLDAYFINSSSGKSIFSFNDSNLISSYSNNPNYAMIKNDFVIWGLKNIGNDTKVPIRYHLAIDKKPKVGNTYQAFRYIDPDDGIERWYCPIKFLSKSNFPVRGAAGNFYMDLSTQKIYIWGIIENKYDYILIEANLLNVTTKDWRTELYFQGIMSQPYGTESNHYFQLLLTEWPKIYNIKADDLNNGTNESSFKEEYIKNSSDIDYYLDFIDSTAAVGLFSIDNIGRRTLVANENENINCIFLPYIPDVVFINIDSMADYVKYTPEELKELCRSRNQDYYQVNNEIFNNIELGNALNSAYQYIRQLIHQYTSYNNSISIQTLPIFFLEPNTRISVNNDETSIHGDYMINSLSFNLSTSSLLTINATKALEKI